MTNLVVELTRGFDSVKFDLERLGESKENFDISKIQIQIRKENLWKCLMCWANRVDRVTMIFDSNVVHVLHIRHELQLNVPLKKKKTEHEMIRFEFEFLLCSTNQFTDIVHTACMSNSNGTKKTFLHFGNFIHLEEKYDELKVIENCLNFSVSQTCSFADNMAFSANLRFVSKANSSIW